MEREGIKPDLILCSSSTRTRETFGLAFAQPQVDLRIEEVLYLASARTILGLVQRIDDGFRHLMVIGHNPGLQVLASELVGSGDEKLRAAMAAKLPTAALVMIEFQDQSWADVRSGRGRLLRFVTPRTIG